MYLIYLTDPDLCEKYYIDSQLYAYTRDKSLAEAFISQRNNKFKIKKKDLSLYQGLYIEKKYSTSFLEEFQCETIGTDKNGNFYIDKIPIVVTNKERNNAINFVTRMVYNEIIPKCYNSFSIFDQFYGLKLKYIQSLINLKIITIDESGRMWGSATTGKLHFDFLKIISFLYSDLF